MKSKSFKRYQLLINIIMGVVTIIFVLPLLLLFMSSITSEQSLYVNGYSFFPKEFSLEGYSYIWNNRGTIFHAYFITFTVTIVGTFLSVLLASLMAYVLSVKTLPFRRVLTFYVFFTMLFSGGLVPSYIMWTAYFHIKNTYLAYILPNMLVSAMNIMLIRTYIQTSIPEAIYEAAQIDGADHLRVFSKIVIPLGKPILVTTGLFSGIAYWNDWTNGLYYISKPGYFSIQVLLNRMVTNLQALQTLSTSSTSGSVPQISVRMAIAFVALLPILVLYPFLQKYFAQGIALGAVKG